MAVTVPLRTGMAQRLRPDALMRDVAAGLASAAVSLPFVVSYVAVMFSDGSATGLAAGMAALLTTTAVVGGVTALLGTIRFGIAGPISDSVVPMAAMLATAAALLPAGLAAEDRLANLLAALSLTAAVSGLGLLLLGWARAGAIARYVPYPVVAGFAAGTGWLLIPAAIRIVTDSPAGLAGLATLGATDAMAKLAATGAFALALALLRRFRHPLALPATLAAAVVISHLGLALAGLSGEAARAGGWLFAEPPPATLWKPWLPAVWSAIHWPTMLALLPDMLAVLVVTALAVLMATSTLEVVAGEDADLNRELRAEGCAALAAAALGGLVGGLSTSRSMVNRAAGGTGRLSGLTCGLVAAVLVAVDGSALIAQVPKLVVGGLLAHLGIQFLWTWTIAVRRELGLVDWLTVCAIVLVIARYGYVPGVGLGVLAGCLIFAVRYARTPIVKHRMSLAERRSNVDRSPTASITLSRLGAVVPILQLQGFVFFGSAYRLHEQVKALLPVSRAVVLDFKLVSGLDSSATLSFRKMAQAAAAAKVLLLLAGLSASCRRDLEHAGLLAGDLPVESRATLDHALERCEELLLADAEAQALLRHDTFQDWLARQLGADAVAARVLEAATRLELESGAPLCRQGDPSDTLLLVERGRVSVVLNLGSPSPVRLRVMDGQAVLGEMGFYTGSPRSASLVAETPTVVHRLSREAYDRLVRDCPEAALALASLIIRLLAERLGVANRLIAAYEQ